MITLTAPSASRPPDPDAALVRRHRTGDPGAFLEIVRRHHTHLFRLAHHLLRDVHQAEDVTKATFTLARRALDRGRLSSPLAAWLYYAAFKLARRRHWQNLQQRTPAASFCAPTVRRPASASIDLREFAALIAACIHQMDPRDCELLALRHVLGLSAGEIAKLLRIRPDVAWSRVNLARQGLLALAQRPLVRASSTARRTSPRTTLETSPTTAQSASASSHAGALLPLGV